MKTFSVHPSHSPEVNGLIDNIDAVLATPSPNVFSVASRYVEEVVVSGRPYGIEQHVQTYRDVPTVEMPVDITELEDPEWFVRHTNDGFDKTTLIIRTDLGSWFIPRENAPLSDVANRRLYDMFSATVADPGDRDYHKVWHKTVEFILTQLEEQGTTHLSEYWSILGGLDFDTLRQQSESEFAYTLEEVSRTHLIIGSREGMLGSKVRRDVLFLAKDRKNKIERFKLQFTPVVATLVACKPSFRDRDREPKAINPYKFDPVLIGKLASLTQQIA